MDDRAVWCRLEDPRQLRGKSPHTSPRGSIAGTGKRNTFGDQRSVSDDVDSIGKPFINAILTELFETQSLSVAFSSPVMFEVMFATWIQRDFGGTIV